MDPNVQQHDRFYRRGLVLGITMAEVMVLILFALLLALAAALAKKDVLIREYRALRERFVTVSPDDVFRELGRQKQEIDKLSTENSRLTVYEQKAREAESVFQELRRSGISKPESAEGLKEIADKQRIANEAIEAAKKAGIEPNASDIANMLEIANAVMAASGGSGTTPDTQQISQLLKDARTAEQRYRDTLGQNRYLAGQLAAATGGKGQLPPCWPSAETGKAEYIFDVTITSTGMVIANNTSKPEMAHRADQYTNLPISMIHFNSEISPIEFRRQTQPIRQWGDEQEQKCKFYVRLIDQTKAEEKVLFKRLMLTTGENFYYWLVPQ